MITHLLKANGAQDAPFADLTLCGIKVDERTSAMWPGESLHGVHWGKSYHIPGRWCRRCIAVKVAPQREAMTALARAGMR